MITTRKKKEEDEEGRRSYQGIIIGFSSSIYNK